MGNFVSELQQRTAFAVEDTDRALNDVNREMGFEAKAGDLVLLRLNVSKSTRHQYYILWSHSRLNPVLLQIHHHGFDVPPQIASKLCTSGLGEEPAYARKVTENLSPRNCNVLTLRCRG